MGAFKDILVERLNSIATITLNRPKVLNGLTPNLMTEIFMAVQEISGDGKVKVVVLTGTGRGFCSGADLNWIKGSLDESSEQRREMLKVLNRTICSLVTLEKPVLGAINGPAVGGGSGLALACDFRIASDRARIGQVFSKLGAIPDCGVTYFLPRIVGVGKALELIYSGEILDAYEAQRIGLFNRVVPHESFYQEVERVALNLANGPTKALGLSKQVIYQSLTRDIISALDTEASVQSALMKTENFYEGIKAFLEKRKADFT